MNKIFRWVIPLSVVISVICVGLISFLFTYDKDGGLVNPLIQKAADYMNGDEAKLQKIENGLRANDISYSEVGGDSGTYYIIKLKGDGDVFLSAQKNLDEQLSSLQYILNRLTMEGKAFSRLDLRFEKPVIVLK